MNDRLGPQAQRAYDVLRDRILTGRLASGTKLPSQAALSRELGVALMTVREGLGRLEREGMVVREHGRGTFVRGEEDWSRLERELEDSKERFRSTFEYAGIGIAHTALDGRWLLANQRLCDFYGYTRAELFERRFQELTHPDDLAADLGLLDRILAGEIPSYQLEKRYIRKDGAVVWGDLTVALVRDAAGAPRYVIATVQDITARKEAEGALREVEQALVESEERFRTIFNAAAIGINLCGVDGRIVQTNPRLQDILGYTSDELLGMRFQDITHPDDIAIDLALYDELLAGQRDHYQLEKRYVRKDGRNVWVHLTVSFLESGDGSKQYTTAMVEDITDRKHAEEVRAQLAAIVQSSDDAIIGKALDGAITSWNGGAQKLYGYSAEEVLGRPIQVLAPPDRPREIPEILERIARGESIDHYETVRRRKDGQEVDVSLTISPVKDASGTIIGASAIARDVTERKAFERQLAHQALHDALTGLPNRVLLRDRLEQAVFLTHRERPCTALLLMDLDGFKEVNDTLGHHCGDLLLRELATRLQQTLRETDTVARLGGDEFALILPKTDRAGAGEVAKKIQVMLNQPFVMEGQQLHVGASIGIALCPEHGDSASALLRRADVAMYRAKRGADDSGCAIYEPEKDEHGPGRLGLASELRHGIERDELMLHHQPIASMKTGRVEHVEALVRWNHPQRGLVPPSEFIPLAEETGLIRPITQWVLGTALRQCRLWYDRGLSIGVSVNLSTRNFLDSHLVDTVAKLIRTRAVSPNWLTVEITETTLIADPERAMAVLTGLHRLGVSISIDDFGTGYSSLAYLKQLPVDEVKIDRSFVMDMTSNDSDAVIVRSVIDLGHNLGLKVSAEGVEDQQTWDALSSMGCDMAQGYFLSRPLLGAELACWLSEHRTGLLAS